jgi:hypothetical protein
MPTAPEDELVPIPVLKRLMKECESELHSLRKERDKLRKRLAKVEARIRLLSGSGDYLRANSVTLVEAISAVLKEAGRPLGVADVTEKVLAAGYQSTCFDFKRHVNQTLCHNKESFVRAGRGFYAPKQ